MTPLLSPEVLRWLFCPGKCDIICCCYEQATKHLTTAQSLIVPTLVTETIHNAIGTVLLSAPKILAVEAMHMVGN
jgi:hypothetical protein